MDAASKIKKAKLLATLLDSQWNILGFKFGIDPFFDLIPGAEIIPTIASFYIIWIAIQLKIPNEDIFMMVGRIILDFFIGAVPWIGSFFDTLYKANMKNVTVIERYYP